MRTREFPVLSGDDREVIDSLAVGLDRDAARALAYLLLRDREPEFDDAPATRVEIRIGTDASRRSLTAALGALAERGLVRETTRPTDQGRPPKAWTPRDGLAGSLSSVYRLHGRDLLAQSIELAAERWGAGVGPGDVAGADHPADGGLTVGLNWYPNPFHAPLFGARAADHYEARGLDASLDRFEGSGAAIAALLAGDADVVVAGAASIVRERTGGAPLVPLAPLVQRASTVLYTTPSAFGGRLTGVEGLRGHRVGMPVGSETGLLGRLFLSQSGVVDDVEIIDVTGEERSALRAGEADVVTGTERDVRTLEASGETIDALRVADHFPIYGPTLVTTEGAVRRRLGALAAFLAGTVAGTGEALARPDRVLEAMRDRGGGADDAGDPAEIREGITAGSAVEEHGWGWHDGGGWSRIETALARTDLLGTDDRDA